MMNYQVFKLVTWLKKNHILKFTLSISCLLFFVSQSACSRQPDLKKIRISGHTMGTQYHISVAIPSTFVVKTDLKKDIDTLLVKINQQMSTYIEDSEINQFNDYRSTDWFAVSIDLLEVVTAAQEVSYATNGAFDITISPLVDLWGFGAKTLLGFPQQEQLIETLKHVGYQKLSIRNMPPAIRKRDKLMQIDLSAIAKGYAVDKVGQLLKFNELNNYLVEIGGEISASGTNQTGDIWQIAIENPDYNESLPTKIIALKDIGVATSGDYRNFFIKDGKRFSHIIDPKTGYPTHHNLASITVLNQSTMIADAYATALLVMGEKRGIVFAKKKKLKINMFIREASSYRIWNSIDGTPPFF